MNNSSYKRDLASILLQEFLDEFIYLKFTIYSNLHILQTILPDMEPVRQYVFLQMSNSQYCPRSAPLGRIMKQTAAQIFSNWMTCLYKIKLKQLTN